MSRQHRTCAACTAAQVFPTGRGPAGPTLAVLGFEVLARMVGDGAGIVGLGSVEGYAASLFALLAIPFALLAIPVGTFAAAVADRRFTMLAAQPLARWRLTGAEPAVTALGAVLVTTGRGFLPANAVPAGGVRVPSRSAPVWAGKSGRPARGCRRAGVAAPL